MKAFRIFSNKQPDCMFASSLIKSVVVIASCEEEAKEVTNKRHGDNFVCNFDEVEIELIGDLNEPLIISVHYFEENY